MKIRRAASVVRFVAAVAAPALLGVFGCADLGFAPKSASAPAPTLADGTFDAFAAELLEFTCAMQPTFATQLGIHTFDDQLEDYSAAGVAKEVAALHVFAKRLAAIDAAPLTPSRQLDREQLVHAVDSRLLTLEVVRPWAKNPDTYSSGITSSVYILIKRDFAPAAERLRLVIAREKAMPAALAQARTNLDHPPRIATEIALEQVGGARDFFATAVPQAFAEVKDAALVEQFKATNGAVIAALASYEQWMKSELLPKSDGSFALGADVYRRKLWADEMVDAPLEQLLELARADLAKNQAAFAATAAQIDPKRSPAEVLAGLQKDHPAPAELLATTQHELDELAAFITAHHIVTIPAAAPARVQETPPFMRATTSASMDTPGPFEQRATEAYYSMTLPDPATSAAEQEEFMTQWYRAAITNVSVHEVWPGHYLQFLGAKSFPSDVRRVFGANTNIEGWAHYCEQMMLDEGFHVGEPKYRLAQLQDALLRDARFVVGIRMHTQGMTVEEAEAFFEREAFQPGPVAESEAKRGTSDPTYGYYTLGKLTILKLREELRAKWGAGFTMTRFHDAFLALGPLPLPLIRKALLGESGAAR